MSTLLLRLFAVPLLVALGACDSVPKAEFKTYADAFDEVKQASEQYLTEYALAKAERAKTAPGAAEPASDYPTPQELRQRVVDRGPDSDIRERRRALEAVVRYNGVMLALAEGKSAQEVASGIGSLIAAVQSVGALIGAGVPGLPGSAVALASRFLAELQKADNRAQFVEALKVGEPLIQGILALLKEDAIDIYTIRFGSGEQQIGNRLTTIRRMIAQMTSVTAEFAPPSGTFRDGFARFDAQLATTLKDAGIAGKIEWPSRSGGSPPAFSALVLTQLQQTTGQIEGEVGKIGAVRNELKAFANLTTSYMKMIDGARASLAIVRTALDRPPDIRAQALQLVEFAFAVKHDFEALQAARAAR